MPEIQVIGAEITVFAWVYHPFIIGDMHRRFFKTVAWGEGPHDLGKGITGYLIKPYLAPEIVVETISGGILGRSLDGVRAVIEAGDASGIAEDLEEALLDQGRAEYINPDDFWAAWGKTLKPSL